MPKLENGKVENLFGIALGATVVGKHPLYGTLFKIAPGHCLGVKQKAMNPVLEIVTEPFFVGDGKARFLTIENFTRHVASECLFGDVLRCEASDFKVLRQGGGEFKNFVVEQWDAELDGIGHGHFVGFDEEIIG